MAPPPISLLDLASTPYAVLRSGTYCWSNTAFQAVAAAHGVRSAELAARLADEASGGVQRAPFPFECRVASSDSYQLIEVVPASRQGGRQPPAAGELDALTGVLGRGTLQAEIDRWFARRQPAPFALAFLDLDQFKGVNDRYGHLAGDACLREVGSRLAGAVRAGDIVGRYGGDEFVLLLAGVSDSDALDPVLDRLRSAIRQPILGLGWEVRLGISVGTAFSCDNHSSPEVMLGAADRAMYGEKRSDSPPAGDVADSSRLR